jgi:hypothetical protein
MEGEARIVISMMPLLQREGFPMIRFSAFIATVMLLGMASAAQAQTKSTTQRQCYNARTCETDCRRPDAVGKSCPKMCDHQRATLPACK